MLAKNKINFKHNVYSGDITEIKLVHTYEICGNWYERICYESNCMYKLVKMICDSIAGSK